MRRFLYLAAAAMALAITLPASAQPTIGGGSIEQSGNTDFQKKLLGNWHFEGMTGPAGYQVWTKINIEYKADNTYQGVISQEMPGLPPSQSALSGRYTIQPAAADTFLLTHISAYRQDQAEYKFVDDNTLLNMTTNGTSRRVN